MIDWNTSWSIHRKFQSLVPIVRTVIPGEGSDFFVSGSKITSFWQDNPSICIKCDALNVGNRGTRKSGVLEVKLRTENLANLANLAKWQIWVDRESRLTPEVPIRHPRCWPKMIHFFGWSQPLVLLGNPIEYGGLELIVGNWKCTFNYHWQLLYSTIPKCVGACWKRKLSWDPFGVSTIASARKTDQVTTGHQYRSYFARLEARNGWNHWLKNLDLWDPFCFPNSSTILEYQLLEYG